MQMHIDSDVSMNESVFYSSIVIHAGYKKFSYYKS